MPDAYEATISEVFPDRAPGSFTWVGAANGGRGWVWTTFFGYQWDLNYANPTCSPRCSTRSLWLANRGIESSGWTPCRSCGSGWAPPA